MTFEDAKVIGIGTVALLIVFLAALLLYVYGMGGIWAIVRRYVILNMSSGPQNEPVPPLVPGAVPLHGTADTRIDLPFLASNLTEAQYIELGARLLDRRGKYVFSGKTLYKIAGGNHDEFLASMRRWRGTEEEEPTITTPWAGRVTKAAYYEVEPGLAYEKPPH